MGFTRLIKKIITSKPDYSDLFLYLAIIILCYFCFNHGDLLLIGGWSFTYLNGHIKDFYEVNKQLFDVCNYLPSTSVIFAIWNMPIKLLGIIRDATTDVGYVIFWYKLLTTVFFAGSAFVLTKIGKLIGLSSRNSMLLMIIWISTPLLIFSQFIFGQTDIFTTFFVLLAIYYFLQRKLILFALFFGISFTFKYNSLFLFFPLLLLVEKNPLKIIGYSALAITPIAMEVAYYFNSQVFLSEMTKYGFIQRTYFAAINILPDIGIYIFPLLWFLICGVCYYIKVFKNNDSFYQTSFYVCLAVTSALFILVFWHPQYLLLITPFLAITTFKSKHIKYFLVLDLVIMFAFIGFTVCVFPMNVDQSLMTHGILGQFNPNLAISSKALSMDKLFSFGIKSIVTQAGAVNNFYFTLFSAILILNILFKFPNRWNSWEDNDRLLPVKEYWNYARLRFLGGMAIFIIPAFIAYFVTLLRT
jgi:hypothetical protein